MKKTETILKKKLIEELGFYFKNSSEFSKKQFDTILQRWSDDTLFSEKHRFDLLNLFIDDLKDKKILDMAAGCGSFVIQGLLHGYDTYGVEPEDWKHELIDAKFEENAHRSEWRSRIVVGYGENLPFENETFDAFDSWQTIEHVGNEQDCINELYRVLKKDGKGILRGPNYKCFYEGHYRMFWFPMMGESNFAKKYLTLRGRPLEGLKTFHPVNPKKIRKYAKAAGFRVVNIKKFQIDQALKRKMPFLSKSFFKPSLWLFYQLWDLYKGIKNFGRVEATISYLLIKN